MLKLTDVTKDSTARSRARLRSEDIATARGLGFDHEGWVSAVPEELSREPTDDDVLIDLVMVHRGGGSILEMSRWRWLEDVAVRTLFEDGTVLLTARIPAKGWWKIRWGVASAPEHGYEIRYVQTRSLAELVGVHDERVRRRRAQGHEPIARHDMRAYLAMRKRWREIADLRMRRQEKIASAIAITTFAVAAFGGAHVTRIAVEKLGAELPAVGLVAGVLSFAAALVIAGLAFVLSIYFFAAILARRVNAPPRRQARDLLALADSVPSGFLPATSVAKRAPAAPPTLVRTSPAELARLRRIDLAIAVSSALLLPLGGLLGTILFGSAAIPFVLGLVFTTDGAIALLAKKTRAQVLRERFVPALVQAEAEATCASGACATPVGRKVLGVAWLLGGLACLHSARAAILVAGSTPAPAWLVAEWFAIVVVCAFFAFTNVKKRHERLITA